MSEDRDALIGELNDLAGGWGTPAAVQYSIDHLPGSSTSNVGYDFSISLGLLLADLATVIETTGPGQDPRGGVPGDGLGGAGS